MFNVFKKHRRQRLRSQPFPPAWLAIIEKNVPIYDRLSEADRRELQGHVNVFLTEKHFEGCGGLTLTDEIKVTIAAQACLLLLHRETDDYPRLITILVYPHAYVAKNVEPIGGGAVLEGEQGRLGEAWTTGVVVLSWDDVRAGASDVRDGHNVVLHEFAHQLDQEDGVADGAPVLDHRSRYVAWERVLGTEYEKLRQASRKGKKSVLDRYGATKPAEFFAVATECFFEKPAQMKKKHPELYEELRDYYRQDPERDIAGDQQASTARPD
jgi:Mlc titration factor MtfA (ptsG expression regulator)